MTTLHIHVAAFSKQSFFTLGLRHTEPSPLAASPYNPSIRNPLHLLPILLLLLLAFLLRPFPNLILTTHPKTTMPKRTTPLPNPQTSSSIPTTFSSPLSDLPSVLVFDLDYTLWPFWCDTHCTPPFKPLAAPSTGTAVTDRHGEPFAFYAHVPGILAACREKGIRVAAASRTHAPPVADSLLRMLFVDGREGKGKPAREYFDDLQIYPGDKVRHMEGIREKLGVEFGEMLFFDDEVRNRNVEREKGVAFWLVRDGVTAEEVDAGVRYWRERRDGKGKGKK